MKLFSFMVLSLEKDVFYSLHKEEVRYVLNVFESDVIQICTCLIILPRSFPIAQFIYVPPAPMKTSIVISPF